MLYNNIKIAFRNLRKHKFFSVINIVGLAIGLTACYFIFLFVQFETSFDSFHKNSDRIYRLVTDIKATTELLHCDRTTVSMAPKITAELPGVNSSVRVKESSWLIHKGNKKFQEENCLMADSTFFSVFSFNLIKGHPNNVLNLPNSVVLTQSTAKKYFGEQDPIGQILEFKEDGFKTTVTGIMEDFPENSHIQGDMVISFTSDFPLDPSNSEDWGDFTVATYFLLNKNANIGALEKKCNSILTKLIGKDMQETECYYYLFLESLKNIHLHSDKRSPETKVVYGSYLNVKIFTSIAILILLIACINFINLSTARSAERAKEVGIKKVIGAVRSQLIIYFMGESFLICLFAFILTLLACSLLLPVFNQVSERVIYTSIFENYNNIIFLFILTICIGLLAGFYPALILSSYKPISILKGKFSSGNKGLRLRSTLVVSQFTISISLIIATIITYKQLDHIRHKDLGLNKDAVVVIKTNYDNNVIALKHQLTGNSNIVSTALSSNIPGNKAIETYIRVETKTGEMAPKITQYSTIDYDFLNLYQIQLVTGRKFEQGFASDTNAMIVNESLAKMYGYSSQEIIGKKYRRSSQKGTIIGVVKDVNFISPKEKVMPLVFFLNPLESGFISIKIKKGDPLNTINDLKDKWKQTIPDRPFDYYFLDEAYDKQYKSEEQFGKLFIYFTFLAIFISCLGLLGLASYNTLQRKKEIGIRKVLGATINNIVWSLSKYFLKLIAISILIAFPLSWWAMDKWLEDFAYRTDISWWMFLTAGIAALIIAFTTISFQAIKAAIANPTKSLRTE